MGLIKALKKVVKAPIKGLKAGAKGDFGGALSGGLSVKEKPGKNRKLSMA